MRSMTYDPLQWFQEALIFLCRKNYDAVVAVAGETSYIYIANTSIQTLGSEFYCYPTLHGGLGGSHALCHALCHAASWYCHVIVMIQYNTIALGIHDSFITSTRRHFSSFFLFYMFLCMFVHPLIYIIKWSKAPYQQKTEAPSSSVNNNNNIIYNNFRNAGIIYVFNMKRLNETKLHYNTIQYNTIIHYYITAHCSTL